MKHTPVSMPCTSEQFECIRPILEANNVTINIHRLNHLPIIVTNYCELDIVADMPLSCKHDGNRTFYPDFNAKIFLEACGIATKETSEDKAESKAWDLLVMVEKLTAHLEEEQGYVSALTNEAKKLIQSIKEE